MLSPVRGCAELQVLKCFSLNCSRSAMNNLPSLAPVDGQGVQLLDRRGSLQPGVQGGMGTASLGKRPREQCEMPVGTRAAWDFLLWAGRCSRGTCCNQGTTKTLASAVSWGLCKYFD